ncbi:MAG: transporter substrate-binding domain-containing protein [Candidatus Riflebacteria bacterium]|nr:transporter substrate-binding domain-containing protein [Candidatus Riflebacteria bacterium]
MKKSYYVHIVVLLIFSFLSLTVSILYAQEANSTSNLSKEVTTLEQLEKMRVGVFGVSANKEIIEKKNPKITNFFFSNSISDAVAALKTNKIDCFAADVPVLQLYANRNPDLKVAPLKIETFNYGVALKKNSPLTEKISKVVKKFKEDGTLEKLKDLWQGKDESKKAIASIPKQDWEGKNGILKAYFTGDIEPFAYIGNNQTLIGLDIHLVYLMAKELDMKVEQTVAQFDSLIPALQSGKADVVSSCLTITKERQQSVDMIPYYESYVGVLVKNEEYNNKISFWQGIKNSFYKTFIHENRWLLITKGLGLTILISIFSGILGFLLGFVLIILKRLNNKYLSGLIKYLIVIINGIPPVVLLMILFYVIFGSIDISPVLVSILTFTITFGATSYVLIGNGIQAVNIGQEEAAKALGFTEFQSFYKVIFPQSAKQFLPLIKGQFMEMVKMTSVVGYVSCIDLTKASDLIRSRTMEAFFPLIVTALIYFIISNLMLMALNNIEISLDPKRRERKIKGVVEATIEN